MTRKKILIVYPGPLFPIIMASQDRIVKMTLRLAVDHDVDVITMNKEESSILKTRKEFDGVVHAFYPCLSKNSKKNILNRLYLRLKFIIYYSFYHITADYYFTDQPHFNRMVQNLMAEKQYDVVQVEYWFSWKVFIGKTKISSFKAIDTHDILFEKRKHAFLQENKGKLTRFQEKVVEKYQNLENNAYKLADLLIGITKADSEVLKNINPGCSHIVIPIGQDLGYFMNYPVHPEKVILFYGGMGSKENIDGFFRLYHSILPFVKKEIYDVKLMVVGSQPPSSISKLRDDISVIVTGYVEDVRPFLSQSSVMVLPLNVGGGFRSRSVEVMAMGIPLVGSSPAFDCLGITQGIEGYITDSDADIAKFTIQLLSDNLLRERMSNACRAFVLEHYSIEKCYGTLSDYYLNLK